MRRSLRCLLGWHLDRLHYEFIGTPRRVCQRCGSWDYDE